MGASAFSRDYNIKNLSGTPRSFSCYALPDPDEVHEEWFGPKMLVPVLVGMDWLHPRGQGVSAIIDYNDGHCCTTNLGGIVIQLPSNHKNHYFLDVVEFLTDGKQCHD